MAFLAQQAIGLAQKRGVVDEVGQRLRVDQQCCVDLVCVGLCQQRQLVAQHRQ